MPQTAIVVFGSTGNLMYKKLLPALYQLLVHEELTNECKIYAIGRRDYNSKDYIDQAKEQVTEPLDWDFLSPYIEYVKMDVNQSDDYASFSTLLDDHQMDTRMIYLAVPPKLFPVIAAHLSTSTVVKQGNANHRVVFEKPFGEDLATAKEINQLLWNYLDEEQIYRIDHYLGKEMIQNILVVRFGNRIFEHTWNNKTIRNIVIMAKETEGVLSRGNYYDTIGALKDMFQSHLLQMLAVTTMSKPKTFDSEDIKDQKITIFNDLKIVKDSIFRGQYKGYTDTEKIDPNSNTETFVYLEARIDQPKWEGVPIYFVTGKKLDQKRSEIIINFKDDDSLLALYPNAHENQNKLIIKVAPDEGVEFHFNVKQPGLENYITTAALDYCHSCLALKNSPEAYEKLLLDLSKQQKTLFTRWDEIEATWTIFDGIKNISEAPSIYENYADLVFQIKREKGVNIDDL
ncbi:glucose-6-phosphate dehydrogenase [Candidatus Xianfuyuplasma coldseepsis]|uniref:Glucose-6-phosphate 1-dehydrogenase n=1 Tax=Candidatus Xianfuyuplasma coldseepsis TaxID=2782163 RepID=A0A7L7KPL0_9MOLU|nr:glucose-6-phosphate dehydrogenase [Xianfuyuplasma coldseepsis]QMS84643.1 glucose-6-phosphate dehydrogenase [Xianfuyuplasma coldseepsis]